MFDDTRIGPPGSRLDEVSRRSFLRRSAGALGLVAIGGLAACSTGGDDAKTFASTTTSTTTTAAGGSTDGSTDATTTTGGTGSSSGGDEGAALPDGAELVVAFTYEPSSSGGRVDNPYIATWIEDADGNLVKALAVWYKTGRDARYLSELTDWSSTTGTSSVLSAVSGATRTPGGYSLQWDGTDLDGARVAAGGYFVCVEAAREHGPHSLVREQVTLGTEPVSESLAPDQELTDVTVDYRLA